MKEMKDICTDPEGALGNDNLDTLPDGISMKAAGKKPGTVTKLFELAGRAKVKFVCNYIEELVNNDTKFLLFCHHRAVMDALQNKLQSLNVEHVRIDGSSPKESRGDLVRTFQEKPSNRIFFIIRFVFSIFLVHF